MGTIDWNTPRCCEEEQTFHLTRNPSKIRAMQWQLPPSIPRFVLGTGFFYKGRESEQFLNTFPRRNGSYIQSTKGWACKRTPHYVFKSRCSFSAAVSDRTCAASRAPSPVSKESSCQREPPKQTLAALMVVEDGRSHCKGLCILAGCTGKKEVLG